MDRYADFKEVTEVSRNLTLLYVEDDETARTFLKRRLESIFGAVWEASNGEEGLERFLQGGIDLIITDNIMPSMNGIEMIREIRRSDTKVPIIITTAFIDTDYLVEAINLGVTQFVSKPVFMEHLLATIKVAIQRVILENLAQKAKEQEIELLQFRDRYHSSQQEVARHKERNMIKNDYYLQAISAPDTRGDIWMLDILYHPLEILSGDSYSVRKIGDHKALLFIIDGMGKGLSASITTTLSIAFVNFLIDSALQRGQEVLLEGIIADYMHFIQKELLDEEVISAGFYLFDFLSGKLCYITFGMPSILAVTHEGVAQRIRSSLPPLMKHSTPPKSKELLLASLRKILLYSDGLNEANMDGNRIYGEVLECELVQKRFLSEMKRDFMQRVKSPDDDITVFWVRCAPRNSTFTHHYEISSSLGEVHRLSDEIERKLEEFTREDTEASTRFMTAFNEMIMNAYEHGSLGIERLTKDRLIQEGTYDEYLKTRGNNPRKIAVETSCFIEGDAKILACEIRDEGGGFDLQEHLQELRINGDTLTSGRGIRLTKRLVDHLYFKEGGCVSCFMIVVQGGADRGSD